MLLPVLGESQQFHLYLQGLPYEYTSIQSQPKLDQEDWAASGDCPTDHSLLEMPSCDLLCDVSII